MQGRRPKPGLNRRRQGLLHWRWSSPPHWREPGCIAMRSGFLVVRNLLAEWRVFLYGLRSCRSADAGKSSGVNCVKVSFDAFKIAKDKARLSVAQRCSGRGFASGGLDTDYLRRSRTRSLARSTTRYLSRNQHSSPWGAWPLSSLHGSLGHSSSFGVGSGENCSSLRNPLDLHTDGFRRRKRSTLMTKERLHLAVHHYVRRIAHGQLFSVTFV